jgi:cytoskeletal protein RodZ
MSTPERPPPGGPDDERGLSGLQRALLALAGLAILLLSFVILQAAGDEGGSSTPQRTTAAQTATATTETGTTATETGTTDTDAQTGTNGETGTTTGATETETETEGETGTTQTQPAAPPVPTISVVDGRPQGGVRRLSFEKGERIRFRVRSNAADEVHVHGYDVTKAVPAGGSALLSFEATIEGRFEVELHEAGSQLAELEVTPS